MPRNHELDSLRSREQDAFQRKQIAFGRYREARDRCNEAHDIMHLLGRNVVLNAQVLRMNMAINLKHPSM